MRKFLIVASVGLIALPLAGQVQAVEADDVPWDEIDRVLKEEAGSAAAKPRSAPNKAPVSPTPVQSTPDTPVVTASDEPAEALQTKPPVKVANVQDDVPAYDGPEDPSAVEALQNGEGVGEDDTEVRDDAAEMPEGSVSAKPAPPSYTLPIDRYLAERGTAALPGANATDRKAIADFYAGNGNGPIWVDENGYNENALKLIEVLSSADQWGLDSATYKAGELSRLLPLGKALSLPDDVRIEAELRSTLAAIAYARDARGGRIEKPAEQLSSYLDRKPRIIETSKLLTRLSAESDRGAYLKSLHPKHEQFERLRQLLIKTRNEAPEKFEKIPRGKVLKPGRSHPHIALVRARLKVPEPGMKPDGTAADATYYDDALAGAVKRYKEKHGIKPVTTAITRVLRNSLNEDRSISEDQILANMEQWRWMPEELGDYHVAVNVPEFLVRVSDGGEIIHEERVITGQIRTQTPIFSHKMRSVTFQPIWNVPQSIIINEILPGLRAGRNSIGGRGLVAKRNGRIIDPWSVDWYSTDIRNYYIYQPPGRGNALGIVKFMFPNKHAVYLHDTPKKSLFNSTTRNFSHGCVRVRNPGKLAELIMAKDRGWDKDAVAELLRGGPENNDIVLNTPVPVHVTYFTLTVDKDGKARRFKDIYGHERRIKYALEGNWKKIARHADHLAPVKPKPARRPRREYSEWGFFDDYPPSSRYRRGSRSAYAYDYYDDYPSRSRRYRKRRRPAPNFFEQLFGN